MRAILLASANEICSRPGAAGAFASLPTSAWETGRSALGCTHGAGAKPAIKGGGAYAALSWANTSDICRVRLVVSGTRGGSGCRSRDRPPAVQPDQQGLGNERWQP